MSEHPCDYCDLDEMDCGHDPAACAYEREHDDDPLGWLCSLCGHVDGNGGAFCSKCGMTNTKEEWHE